MKLIKLYPKKPEDYLDDLRCSKRTAQHEVYQMLSGKMLSVCRQYINDIHYAEDVMITAFMKVFTIIDKYERKGSFEGWVRRIMINESISFLRAQKKLTYLDDVVVGTEDEVEDYQDNLSLEDIQILIDDLPEGCRMVFNLFALEGLKHNEIAQMLQINEGTSKSQLSLARKLLKNQLNNLKKRGLWNGVK